MMEYRVSWKRDGMKPKRKVFQTLKGAKRLLELLGPEPWKAWGGKAEDYFCCNGWECVCGGETVKERSESDRKSMPALEWIRIENRIVESWCIIGPANGKGEARP